MNINEVQYQLLAYLDKNAKLAERSQIEHNGFWNLAGLNSPDVVNPLAQAGHIQLGKDARGNPAAKLTEQGQQTFDELHAQRAQEVSPWTKWAQTVMRNMISRGMNDPTRVQQLQEVLQSGNEPSADLKIFAEQSGLT